MAETPRPQPTVCTDPCTGEVIGHSPVDTPEDVCRVVARAREAQPAWAALPVCRRAAAIRRLRQVVVDQADDLAATISRDNGKTRVDAIATEVLTAVLAADYYARKARRFLRDRRLGMGTILLANKRSRIARVPFGVVGIVSPWNYPFAIPFSEVVMALLAGNAVVLKVATQTQMVGRWLERAVQAAGLPEGLVAYVNLPGAQAGDAILAAGIDKLFFTGSVAVGKQLMAKAAATLTPVVLELGGNDPMLVCPDADLDRAAAGAAWAGLQNAGQSCGGVERIYVHRDVYGPFLDRLGAIVRALRVGRDTGFDVDIGAMTTRAQLETVRRHVDEAVAQGATIHAQSACPKGAGLFLPAMVLTNVTHDMLVMREETFGPVVGVMPVADMDEAVHLANDSHLGLTASVWSRNRHTAMALARRLQAGVVTVNDHLMSHGLAETPWGGFKQSGIGRTHGRLGFDEMTQPRCLVTDLMPMVKRDLFWYPHGPAVYAGIRALLDLLHARNPFRRLAAAWRVTTFFPRTFTAWRPKDRGAL